MKRVPLLLFASLVVGLALAPLVGEEPTTAPAPLAAPRILLANGDYAGGRLVDSEQPNQLSWQCTATTTPFEFPVAAISSIYFPQPAEVDDDGDFVVELLGGDAIVGSLKGLSEESVELESKWLGTVRIDRAQVRRIARCERQGETYFSGPNGLAGWTSDRSKHPWKDEGGQLAADSPGTISYAGCAIPPRVSIDLEASWQRKASFSVHFGSEWQKVSDVVDKIGNVLAQGVQVDQVKVGKPDSLFSLETWGDWLVVVRETETRADVAPVLRLSEGPGRVHLRIFFDRASGRVAVYSAEGTLLGEATAPDDGLEVSGGLRLENKAGDLRVEYLAVGAWFGESPTAVEAGRSYLQRTGGEVVYSESLTYDADAEEFVALAQEQEKSSDDSSDAVEAERDSGEAASEKEKPKPVEPMRIAAAETGVIAFQPAEIVQSFAVRASLFDGSRISGDLERVVDGRLRLRRAGIDEPLELPVDQIRLIASLVAQPQIAPPAGRLARLETDGVKLQGSLVDTSGETPGSCLRWLPLGSAVSSPLVKGISGRIVYRDPPPPPKTAALRAGLAPRVAVRVAVRPKQAGVLGVLQAIGVNATNNNQNANVSAGGAAGKSQLLWLRGGDRLPCTLQAIDERGVTFESPTVEAKFLPHDAVKAWERHGGRPPRQIDDEKRERLLTLPRMQRANPPTHLIESTNGDYLRGRLEELNEKSLLVNVRLETKRLLAEQIESIVWFEEVKTSADDQTAPGEIQNDEHKTTPEAVQNDPAKVSLQALRADGVRLTFEPQNVSEGVIKGGSELLGACRVDVREVDQLLLGSAIGAVADELAYHQWRLKPAADPRFVSEGDDASPSPGRGDSEMAGQPAPDFRLDLMHDGEFKLSEQRGKVVVLDFWASWCGPCMQSMPKLCQLAEELQDRDIRFVAVNMQEDRETAAEALERLEIELEVALDVDGATAEKYAVSAIPQTVVIDREGNVAAVLIGGGPDLEQRLREAVLAALEQP